MAGGDLPPVLTDVLPPRGEFRGGIKKKKEGKEMKKIFGISLFALLAISPIMAGAEVVAGDPGATTSSAAAASATPKYALKNSADTDGNAATAGYVKGAYNAISRVLMQPRAKLIP